MTANNFNGATAVLVHAAWANASSWNKVIVPLLEKRMQVVAVQIPLTSLSDDVAAVRRALKRLNGPIVLVGHSYAGAVISVAGTHDLNVKALVYVAAIAPDEGETVGTLFHRATPHRSAPQLSPDSDGLLWLPSNAVASAVAPDATPDEIAVMQATQTIAIRCLGEALTQPAWKDKPSWFIIAEKDRMISPDTQRYMAERMGAHIHSLPVDHTRF